MYPKRLVGELYVKGEGALMLLPSCPVPLRLRVLDPPHVPDDEAKNAPLPSPLAPPPRPLLPRRPGLLLLPPPLPPPCALDEVEDMLVVVGAVGGGMKNERCGRGEERGCLALLSNEPSTA